MKLEIKDGDELINTIETDSKDQMIEILLEYLNDSRVTYTLVEEN